MGTVPMVMRPPLVLYGESRLKYTAWAHAYNVAALGYSRLSCQIILTKELEGMELQLASATRNFYVDGHAPTPH